jgi:hypothetical protein
MRLSFVLAPKQQRNEKRSSTGSSVYSQDARPAAAAAVVAEELNRANFRANSSLYPAPLSPRSRLVGEPPSSTGKKENSSSIREDSKEANTDDDDDQDQNGDDEEQEEEEEEEGRRKLAIPATIASLRRMNSGISAASSLASITGRNPSRSPSPPPPPSPKRMALSAAASSSPAKVGGGSAESTPARTPHSQSHHRKSIGARNYLAVGESSPRLSRNGIVRRGGGGGGGSPTRKRRRPTSAAAAGTTSSAIIMLQQRLLSSSLGGSAGEEEGKENTNGGKGTDGDDNGDGNKDKAGDGDGGGLFKLAAGEFTFEVSSPTTTTTSSNTQDGLGKGGALGLREGSAANVNNVGQQQQQGGQRLSLAWKPAVGEGPGSNPGSPSRGSLKSVDSLGLYDRQGFLISASPARGLSPVGLRV